MKSKIFGRINSNSNQISLYLVSPGVTNGFYLFSTRYSHNVYEFFRQGRSVSEIKAFSKWEQNYRIDSIVSKLPAYIRYAERELVEDMAAA